MTEIDDLEIVWQATVVGRLTNVECETLRLSLFAAGTTKYEGDFQPAAGAIASQFQQRLAALETLSISTAGSFVPGVIYSRAEGRAKVALFNSDLPMKDEP